MSITVHMPNEKVAKAFLAAKPDNVDAKSVTVKVDDKLSLGLSRTKTNARRVGVMSVTKAENAQLGLLLKYIITNDEVYNSLPADVLRYPEALNKLASRYS